MVPIIPYLLIRFGGWDHLVAYEATSCEVLSGCGRSVDSIFRLPRPPWAPSRSRLEREDELRDVLPLLAGVELLLGVLTLGGVLDQEAVVRSARVHVLDKRRDVPLSVALARRRRSRRACRR